jgi:hypothetical protein
MDERYTRLTSMDKAEKEMKNMETKSATVGGIRTEDVSIYLFYIILKII